MPWAELKKLQDAGDFTHEMALREEMKDLPFGDIWAEYLKRQGLEESFMDQIDDYERQVLSKRK
jgi:L-rhamnose isomerase